MKLINLVVVAPNHTESAAAAAVVTVTHSALAIRLLHNMIRCS